MDISATFAPANQETVSLEIDILTETAQELQRFSFLQPLFRSGIQRSKRKKKKTSGNIWKICLKVLTFAPAFREDADAESASLIEAALRTSSSFISLSQRETTRKRKKKKNFRNYLEDILKSSYLCIRFLKRKAVLKKKRSLKNLHKQYKQYKSRCFAS